MIPRILREIELFSYSIEFVYRKIGNSTRFTYQFSISSEKHIS